MEAGCHTTPMLADKGTRKAAFSDSYDVVDFLKRFSLTSFFLKQDVRKTAKSAVMAMTASSAIQKPQV